VAAALFALRFAERTYQQQSGEQIPQPADVKVRPAIGIEDLVAGGFQQAIIQAPARQQGKGQPANENPKEDRIPFFHGMKSECL